MSDKSDKDMPDKSDIKPVDGEICEQQANSNGLTRRNFLNTMAAGTAAGAGLMMTSFPGFAGHKFFGVAEAAGAGHQDGEVAPGKLDDYYGFWSGGHSGEIRIIGVPSMREIKRIPVYNLDAATGHGQTDSTKQFMRAHGRKVLNGDTHHVHLSYNKGTYDGKYVFVNDKLNARLARIRIDYLRADKTVDLPNCQGTHGIFPMRTRVRGMPYYVFCNSEFRTPQPNDGRDLDNPKKYGALHTAVDGERMRVKWQVRVNGNLDLCATDYKGRFSMATCYNSEEAIDLAGMMRKDRDWAVFFHTRNIEKGVKAGDTTTIGKSRVPVVDARRGTKGEGKYAIFVPVPKSPHGINVDPTGRYAICSGKLSPTCTVIDLDKVEQAFAGKIKPEDCIVGQAEVGLGPLHTLFDGKGNAYTSIFIDSQITKWNIDKAIRQYHGEKVEPVIEKIDVHYQPGHCNASMAETKDADGKWVVALCKFSKDRFLPVGPRHPDNDQLIDITGNKMRLVHDDPVHHEPHDAVIVRRDMILPKVKKVYDPKDPMFDGYRKLAKKDGVTLDEDNKVVRYGKNKVRVWMTSAAPEYGLNKFRVRKGDTVKIILTNIDDVEDLTHGFGMSNYGINFGVSPGQTKSVTFKANKAGVYWYYCTWFCHALHLEMRGRMIVEA